MENQPAISLSPSKPLLGILLLAFGLRLFLAADADIVLWADSDEYHEYAKNLAEEHTYYFHYTGKMAAWQGMTFRGSRPPGYPFFIAAIYLVTGPNPRAVLFVQAALDTLSVYLLFLLAARLLDRRRALLAAFLYALACHRVAMIMSEVLTLFLVLAIMLLLADAGKITRAARAALIGALFGFLVLTRPQMTVFAPFIGLYYFQWHKLRPSLKPLAILFAVSLLLIVPWLVRCHAVLGRFVFLSTIGGRTFHHGSYIPRDGHDIMVEARLMGMDEAGMDRHVLDVTLDYLKQHPAHAFRVMFTRAVTLWTWKMEGGDELKYLFRPLEKSGSPLKHAVWLAGYLGYASSRLLSYLGLLGMFITIKNYRRLSLLYAPPIILTIFHFLFFYGIPRYLVPAYPALCVFAGMMFTKGTRVPGPRE